MIDHGAHTHAHKNHPAMASFHAARNFITRQASSNTSSLLVLIMDVPTLTRKVAHDGTVPRLMSQSGLKEKDGYALQRIVQAEHALT